MSEKIENKYFNLLKDFIEKEKENQLLQEENKKLEEELLDQKKYSRDLENKLISRNKEIKAIKLSLQSPRYFSQQEPPITFFSPFTNLPVIIYDGNKRYYIESVKLIE